MANEFHNDLYAYIKAGYPIITILSAEEDRVIEGVDVLLHDPKIQRPLFIWSITRGFVDMNGKSHHKGDDSPESALAFVAKHQGPAVFLFKDFNDYLKDNYPKASYVIRATRDLVNDLKATQKCMLWVTPVMYLPAELEKDVTIVEMPLPEEAEYKRCLDDIVESVKDKPKVMIDLDEEGRDRLIRACQGLTKCEVENALAKTIVSRGRLTGSDVQAILHEKEQIIRKSGILEFTPLVEEFGRIGGLGNLKRWLKLRNRGFSQKARDFGLPYPRCVMLVGVPGCGKSLCAKAVAAEWQMPLLKFDLGRVFQSRVGESEENMRKALSVAEGVAPAILWIDELEKGLAGMGGANVDGGVSARVFGNLLTWMEEKQKPVFVVATGNNIDKLPPELLRKGRMDEIFFVDLPTPQERGEIIAIHIAKYRRAPADYNLAALVRATEGFSGSELEELVKSSLYEAFDDEKKDERHDLKDKYLMKTAGEGIPLSRQRLDAPHDLKDKHLMKIAGEIVPLSRSRKVEIERLRTWAEENCRPAAELPVAAAASATEEDSVAQRRGRLIDV